MSIPLPRESDLSGAPEGLSFEHFLPWIDKIMFAYQDKEGPENDELVPQGTNFSKGYYTKKVN